MKILKEQINVSLMQYKNQWFVYCIYNNSECIYIGSSHNIYKRFKEHKYQKSFTHIVLTGCKDKYSALLLERALIYERQPIYNKDGVNQFAIPHIEEHNRPLNLDSIKQNYAVLGR